MNLHTNATVSIEPNGHSFPSMNALVHERSTDWREPPSLLLDESGLIQDCSQPVESLFGYRLGELAWKHISCLFPHFSETALIQQGHINPKLDFISRCGHIFLGLNRHGDPIPTELNFIRFEHNGLCTLKMILRPSTSTRS